MDNIEVIVVNDGSDDSVSLKKIIKKYEDVIFFEHKENKGMCAARNTGIKN